MLLLLLLLLVLVLVLVSILLVLLHLSPRLVLPYLAHYFGLVCSFACCTLSAVSTLCKQGVFMDYNELAIQFGYATLFAVAFPAAPMLAFVNNVIEARSDAWKLCSVYKRYEFRRCQDIGAWEGVFNTIAVIAVMTNAALTGVSQSAIRSRW